MATCIHVGESDALHARARAFVTAFERGAPMPESFDALASDLARFQGKHVAGYASGIHVNWRLLAVSDVRKSRSRSRSRRRKQEQEKEAGGERFRADISLDPLLPPSVMSRL